MGKISQGVLGGFSGKVGNVVGGTWKGIDYMRIKPSNVANPRTAGQVNQRSKFSTALKFLQTMKGFIRVGFKSYANRMSQFNAAMSYNLNNAVSGTGANVTLDYANALVSRGGLTGVFNGNATSSSNDVEFKWTDNSGSGNAKETDKAMFLVYNPSKELSIYETAGPDRSTEAYKLIVPGDFVGDDVEVYMGFVSEDGKSVSDSEYLGSVTIV